MFSQLLAGQYERWRGLPARLTIEQLTRSIGAKLAPGPVERNRIASRFTVFEMQRKSAPQQLEAWVPLGQPNVAIVEIEDPVCRDVERALAGFGAPEAELQDKRLVLDYTVEEFVYANRGIVLSVGRASPALADRRRALLHVTLFPPMTLQRYLTEVGTSRPALPNTHP